MKSYQKYLSELFDTKTDFEEKIFKEPGFGSYYNYETEVNDNILNVTFRDNFEDFTSSMNVFNLNIKYI